MATRSTIALEYADGTVDRIYCHWDGYLEHNGKILLEHYTDPFKVQQMMDLGDISSLAASIEQPEGHSFDNAVEGYTVFYGRDRGEDFVSAKRFRDYDTYRKTAQFEEFNYILRNDGKWYVEFYGRYDGLLETALSKEAV